MLTTNQLRNKYLAFFTDQVRRHAQVPSANLVPENDPTTLFTGSGMQPMMPYLLGAKHAKGSRITDSQKCFRAEDIEEVGDNRHTTFFEMLGNWSFGDYFKKEQLSWFFEFLTKEVGLDPHKLYVSVFAGDKEVDIPQDDEAVQIWQELFASVGIEAKAVKDADKLGMQEGRIFYYPSKKNWWSRAGQPSKMPVGEPGGPDSEVFYDFGAELQLHEQSAFKDQPCHINCDCGRFLEIGNNVFMQYLKTKTGFEPLKQKNIDFGGGLERILAAANNDPDVFKTDAFWPIIAQLEQLSQKKYVDDRLELSLKEDQTRSFRVIADHLRGAVMLATDGVYPSNKEQGYFARRLVRRAVRYGKKLGLNGQFIADLIEPVVEIFAQAYPQVKEKQALVKEILVAEEAKFLKTLEKGLREFDKLLDTHQQLSAQQVFHLYETYGFPLELSLEEAQARQLSLETDLVTKFNQAKQSHSQASRSASAQKFKGGLADHSQINTAYHTTTHLLHAALRQILGDHVAQKGSNITNERLRFDFTHDQALTEVQKQAIEDLVNTWIKAALPVTKQVMAKKQALESGALAFFVERYPDQVNVYTIGKNPEGAKGDLDNGWISKELCGGPHISNTQELSPIKVFKEKSAAAGVRRIYAQFVS